LFLFLFCGICLGDKSWGARGDNGGDAEGRRWVLQAANRGEDEGVQWWS